MDFGDLGYLKSYIATLLDRIEDPAFVGDTDSALFQLIALNRNDSMFFGYFVADTEARMISLSLDDKQKFLNGIKSRLKLLMVHPRFDTKRSDITQQLYSWIDTQLLLLSSGSKDHDRNSFKFTSTLKAVELSYFMKLQYDRGLYGELKLDAFVEQVANNFGTVSQDVLSASSLKSKLYPKDPAVVSVVENLLVEMLAELRSKR